MVWTLLTYSFQVPLRTGVASFAGVGFCAIGAYTAAILTTTHGWPTVPAILAATVICALTGLLLSLILSRLRSLYLAMATVAFALLVQIAILNLKALTNGPAGFYGVPLAMTTLSAFLVVAVATIVVWRRGSGAQGRRIEAVRVDERLAKTLGIDVNRERHIAFVLSAVLGCLAGCTYVFLFTVLTPELFGFNMITTALEMIVIGGSAFWLGPVVGVALITWLPEWLAGTDDWRPIVVGLTVLVMAVYFADTGLVGLLGRGGHVLADRWRASRRPAQTATATRT
jgi:branched-chain amino acid transport system permease protein